MDANNATNITNNKALNIISSIKHFGILMLTCEND